MFRIIFQYSLWAGGTMKRDNKNEAFSSIEILITLFVLSILLIAFSFALNFYQLKTKKIKQKENEQNLIENYFIDYLDYFKSNLNPDYDGPNDEVYINIPDNIKNCIIEIKPLSGLIDLNYLPAEFYSKPYFLSLLQENTDSSFIEQYRNDNKLITSYNDIAQYITEENFNKAISLFHIININTADEVSLSTYCKLKDCMTDIVSKRHILSTNKQYLKNETDASLYFGLDYDLLKPYVSITPSININFADEEFITSLLSLKRFNLPNYQQKAAALFEEKNKGTLNSEQICNILGISNNDELYYYVGCKTFFWKIDITLNTTCCTYTVFKDGEKFFLIQKRWK